MVKLGWIEKGSDCTEKIFKLRSFFGVASLTLIPFHEIGHIVLHSKKNTFIEFDEFEDKLEYEANIFAANALK